TFDPLHDGGEGNRIQLGLDGVVVTEEVDDRLDRRQDDGFETVVLAEKRRAGEPQLDAVLFTVDDAEFNVLRAELTRGKRDQRAVAQQLVDTAMRVVEQGVEAAPL